jgi:hypothetical protein
VRESAAYGILLRVDRLERLVVHVEEALRLVRQPGEAHQRLALMLLDSAAELLLHRACQGERRFEHVHRQLLELYQAGEAGGRPLDAEEQARKIDLEGRLPTAKESKQIDRLFDAKAEFLEKRGVLNSAQVRVLRKLHLYRNEVYHRDTLRSGSLHSAVRIYSYLVCTLMRDLRTQGLMIRLTLPEGLFRTQQGWAVQALTCKGGLQRRC